jgi:hypothetical protein
MATIFNRGITRSLPALLALVLGFLVAPQPAVESAIAPTGTVAAAGLDATPQTTAVAPTAPAALPPAEPAAPAGLTAGSAEHISAGPHIVRAQLTVGPLGSRAPPSPLA